MTLTFNRDFEPRHGETVEVAPGVRRVTARNEGPFTYRGTNTFLIGDDRQVVVLDPGPDDPAHVEAVLRAIGDAELVAILVTHTHRDHSPASRLLAARRPAPIMGAAPRPPSRLPRADEMPWLDASTDSHFAPDKTLVQGSIVTVGDLRLEAVATPGHTSSHLAFALVGRDILFSGDHVMGWSTTIVAPPDGSMSDYMASLDRVLARPEKRYLPAHGGAVEEAHTYVRALKSHRAMREAAILQGLRSGDRTIPELVARVYSGLDARLAGAASLSTLAHLEDLVERGAVFADGPPALDRHYWVSDADSPGLAGSG